MYQFLKRNNLQILKFLVSGVTASIINFLMFHSIYLLFNNILIASVCGYFVGLIVSFILAKNWVFQNKTKQTLFNSFYIFCLVYLLGLTEMTCVIFYLNTLINNHKIAWFFGAFIASLNNYLGSKYFSFRK